MGHRERVLLAMNRKEPDRPPLDLGGAHFSIVESPPYGYRKLCEFMGLGDVQVSYWSLGTKLVYPIHEKILEAFDIDFRHILFNEPVREMSESPFKDSWGVVWKCAGDHFYAVDPPMAEAKDYKDVESYRNWPDPAKDPIFPAQEPFSAERIRKQAQKIRQETDYAAGCFPVDLPFLRYTWLRGFSQTFLDMKFHPELYASLMEKIVEICSGQLEAYVPEVADLVDYIGFADDFGSQYGPLLSVEQYRTNVKPWFKKLIHLTKKLAPEPKIFYHCCGSIFPLIPEFIDAGIDILNPLQLNARNMDPERIKKEYGDRLCFHGGIDQLKTLPFGTVEDVDAHVKKVLSVFAKGGGYIVAR